MIQQYFQSFGIFQHEEIEDFLWFFVISRMDKGEYFVREGERFKKRAFIKSVVFRGSILNQFYQ